MRSSSSPSAGATHLERSWPRRVVLLVAVIGLAVLPASPRASAMAGPAEPAAAAVTVVSDESKADNAPGYPWDWPVAGPRILVDPFRAPAHDYGPGHRGMDVTDTVGGAVRAPASGVVAFRGTVVDRPLLTIDHGGGYVTTFEPVSSELAVGAVVERGDVIGAVATGGHAPRGTLHVGVRIDEAYANPHPLFGAVPRAVLLPCCER